MSPPESDTTASAPTNNSQRHIYKRGSSEAIKAVLEHILSIELIHPSDSIWLVSPWISDFVVLDNRQYGYHQLVPEWPRAGIRLSEMLSTILRKHRTRVSVITRPSKPAYKEPEGDRATRRFVETLKRQAPDEGTLRIGREKLEKIDHGKGLLTDRIFLHGSMNLTYSGVNINGEHVRVTKASDEVNTAYVNFRELWPSVSEA